jgi:transposase
MTSLNRGQVFKLRQRYLKDGLESVKIPIKEGKKFFTDKQLEELKSTITNKQPTELGYKAEFWTCAILADYIETLYGIKFASKTSYYLIFRKVKYTFHKPEGVYHKHDEAKVELWKTDNLEQISKAWEDDNTVILCEDECVIRSTTTFQKVWLPSGIYPKVEITATRKNRSFYGFLDIKTGRELLYTNQKQNSGVTIEMLTKVRKEYPDKDILLIWDNAGWHTSHQVMDFVAIDPNLTILNFPPYSPELNPQEHVWKVIRKETTHNQYIPDFDKKIDEIIQYASGVPFCYKLLEFGI